MSIHLKTRITAIGPEVADLAEGGVLILFADGSPPELAEVSVLHVVEEGPEASAPAIGAKITIGSLKAEITAVGESAGRRCAKSGTSLFPSQARIQLIAPVKSVPAK